MKRRIGSATISGGSATLENSRNTIPLGNFATVCEKFWKQFLRNIINQIRVGNVVHRSKMLSQPFVLLRASIHSNQGVDRHNDSTCLRVTRIYDNYRVTA